MIKPLLIALSAILVLPNFVDMDIQADKAAYNGKEKFSPQLSFINSVDKLEKFVDAAARDKKIPVGSVAYLELLENTVSHRFYHGFSHKTLRQDWITAVSDRIAGTDYSCLVLPEEILQHPEAACSQQAIVMMEVLKRKNINYREIGFPHHFAMEASVNGGWYYLDANMEPDIRGTQRLHQDWHGHADSLKKYYNASIHPNLDAGFGTGLMAEVNKTNEEQAPNLKKLQTGTGILSRICWMFPLVLLAFARKRSFRMYAIKPLGKYVRMQPMRPVFNA
jgi:hypothetical protein